VPSSRCPFGVAGGPADHLTGRSGVTPIPDVPDRARLLLLRAISGLMHRAKVSHSPFAPMGSGKK
jgi:hypothetical protein